MREPFHKTIVTAIIKESLGTHPQSVLGQHKGYAISALVSLLMSTALPEEHVREVVEKLGSLPETFREIKRDDLADMIEESLSTLREEHGLQEEDFTVLSEDDVIDEALENMA